MGGLELEKARPDNYIEVDLKECRFGSNIDRDKVLVKMNMGYGGLELRKRSEIWKKLQGQHRDCEIWELKEQMSMNSSKGVRMIIVLTAW